jgi:hypothetical protein
MIDQDKCSHPALVKEVMLGKTTGDLICTGCGLALPRSDWPEERSEAADRLKNHQPTAGEDR